MASNDITQLKFPDNVRTRYGMYIGDALTPTVILREVIDNSIDEIYESNSAKNIWIFNLNGYYLVADDGRGIPIKASNENKDITMTQLGMETLHAGSKFKKKVFNIGMNGVGASCTNALSESFVVYTKLTLHNPKEVPERLFDLYSKDKNVDYYFIEYKKGIKINEGFVFSKNLGDLSYVFKHNPSTITLFKPDMTIFKSDKAKIPTSLPYVKYIMKSLGKDIHIWVNDVEYTKSIESLGFDFKVKQLSDTADQEDCLNSEIMYLISFNISDNFEEYEVFGSVNGVNCSYGIHIKSAEKAFSSAFSQMFGDCNGYELHGIDLMVILLCNEPVFSSQTKERLYDIPGIKYSDTKELTLMFYKIIENNYEKFEYHYHRVLEFMKSVDQIGKIELIKSSITIAAETSKSNVFMPIKLSDCSTPDREQAELYIVEGNSAGNTLLQARNSTIHAVLPLRGKPMNTVFKTIEDTLENTEIRDLINCIGVGVNDYYNLDEVRYGKIILTADPDPDGKSINALILGALAYHMTFLIEEGYVYIADIPLFYQNGKYIYDETLLDRTKEFTRFKGLGEMNPDQLKTLVLDKNTRKLMKIDPGNIDLAYAVLTSTEARKNLLIERGGIDEEPLNIKEIEEIS